MTSRPTGMVGPHACVAALPAGLLLCVVVTLAAEASQGVDTRLVGEPYLEAPVLQSCSGS